MAWLPGLQARLPGAGVRLAAALLAHWLSVRIVRSMQVA